MNTFIPTTSSAGASKPPSMFLSGKPLRSVLPGDRARWPSGLVPLRCPHGAPSRWTALVHPRRGLRHLRLEAHREALQQERNVVSAILDTVGALVTVLDPEGRIVRFNRACELTTGYSLEEVAANTSGISSMLPEESRAIPRRHSEQLSADLLPQDYQSHWVTATVHTASIAWSSSMLPGSDGTPNYIIATGIDITERKQLERALLEISAREQRRIGQDLHDGLGQHLTGIAFMAKVHEAEARGKAAARSGRRGQNRAPRQ